MNWKKVMASTLSVCMLATCVPEISELGSYAQTDKVVKAATEKNVVSGKCGKKATWKYNKNTNTLTIGGSGNMEGYYFDVESDGEIYDTTPWGEYKNQIKKVVVGNKVTEIGNSAFAGCTALKEVEGGKNVKTIGYQAFFGNTVLEKINLGDQLQIIYTNAFLGCEKIKSVYIGKALKKIYSGAFAGCNALRKIKIHSKNKYFVIKKNDLVNKKEKAVIFGCLGTDTTCNIGADIETIDFDTLRYNSNIESIKVGNENKTYSSQDGLLYSKDGKKMYLCPQGKEGTVTVRSETTTIGKSGEGAFEGCAKVEKIVVGEKVKKMYMNFEGCTNLKDIEIAEGNAKYSSAKGSILSKDGKTLLCCVATDNGTYKIPEGVTDVDIAAFRYRFGYSSMSDENPVVSIEHLILSDTLESFSKGKESYYFSWDQLEGLRTITFGEKYYDGENLPWLMETLDKQNLEAINVSEKNLYYSSVGGMLYNKEQTKLILCPRKAKICNMPATVTSIDEDAFYDSKEENCLEQLFVSDAIEDISGAEWVFGWNLKKIYIGKKVNTINVNMYGKGLEEITISPENQFYKVEDNVVYTKDGSKLLYCPKAKNGTVTICSGTSIVGEDSLMLCQKVTDIIIPDTVKTVEKNAFSGVNEKVVFWVPDGTKEFYEALLTSKTGFETGMSIKEMQ